MLKLFKKFFTALGIELFITPILFVVLLILMLEFVF